jgi:hypothetical protein
MSSPKDQDQALVIRSKQIHLKVIFGAVLKDPHSSLTCDGMAVFYVWGFRDLPQP